MNSSINFFKFLTRNNRIYFNHGQFSRAVQQFNSKEMASQSSLSQLKIGKQTFQDVLPSIIDSLTTRTKFSQIPDIANWTKKILDYNLTGGKKTRGLTTVLAYEMLEKPENITEESLKNACILGWCVEMLQAYFLVLDDIMDGSTTRRGMPCWYKMADVGLGAINDSILLYTSIFEVLRANFSSKPYYTDLVNLFNETTMVTSMGQHLDIKLANRNKNDYSLFTVESYDAIARYKTSYYTYKFPVVLGMTLANVTDKAIVDCVEDICVDIGQIFQMQDDYIDCFGNESVTGKAGTDIQEGKCTWLATQALKRCNDQQRQLFTQHYGSKQPDDVQKIIQLYKELNIPELYKQKEQEFYDNVIYKSKILPVSDKNLNNALSQLFMKLLDMIHNRKG